MHQLLNFKHVREPQTSQISSYKKLQSCRQIDSPANDKNDSAFHFKFYNEPATFSNYLFSGKSTILSCL